MTRHTGIDTGIDQSRRELDMHHPTNHFRSIRSIRRLAAVLAATTLATGLAVMSGPPARATGIVGYPITDRVSVDSTGDGGTTPVSSYSFVSDDGRYVVFDTESPLVPDDTNGVRDVYRHDRLGGTTRRVSVKADGSQLNDASEVCGASRSGRFVGMVITPVATGKGQIYLHDNNTDAIAIVSVNSAEQPSISPAGSANAAEWLCPISDDSRYVAFQSRATNLVTGDADGGNDIYRRDRTLGVTELVSMSSASVPGDKASGHPAMSADGSVIAFDSAATNLVAGDNGGKNDVFVRVPSTSTTTRASVSQGNVAGNDNSYGASISGNGNLVAFTSYANTLVAGDGNSDRDVFLRNRSTGAVLLETKTSAGVQVAGWGGSPVISTDGSVVAFTGVASNLPGSGSEDMVYRHTISTGVTELVSMNAEGQPVAGDDFSTSLSANGNAVEFVTTSKGVRHDTNGMEDVYVREFFPDQVPFGTIDMFIGQQYTDFVGRAPTAAEVTEWKARLRNGELSLDGVIVELERSAPFVTKRGPLVRLYWAFFLRGPDKGGLEYWTKKLTGGATLSSVATQFAKSSEFQDTYGSVSNSTFVTMIYANIFDRQPDAGGLAFWTKRLDDHTKTRGQVMVNFSESSEGKRVLRTVTDIILIWYGMLRDVPGPALQGWVNEVGDSEPSEIVSQHIRGLQAYYLRLV
jgi:hypothetical protein